MAKKKKKRNSKKQPSSFFDDLSPQTRQGIAATGFVVLGIVITLALFDYAGMVGTWINVALNSVFGGGAYLAPFICAFYVYAMLNPKDNEEVSVSKIIGIALFFIALLGLLALYSTGLGGWAGWLVHEPLFYLMGNVAAGVLLSALFLVGLFLTFNTGFALPGFMKRTTEEEESIEDELELPLDEVLAEQTEDETEAEAESAEEEAGEPKKKGLSEKLGLNKSTEFAVSNFQGPYDPPPLSLLNKDKGRKNAGDTKANSNIIKRTLKNFKIDVEMDEVTVGPTVTRYALKPAEGVRIARIAGLQSDLELALAASPIRIEAPIPGKSLVGIEVPNVNNPTIGLASLLTSPQYTDSPHPLLIALGKDITGSPVFQNIARMPHALIAGTTGAGKSVTMNNIIISLLFRNSPEQLRFIMVDPKRVELTFYNGIPHLLTPVITDAKKTILALKWAIKEMERRYDVMQAEKVRDIDSYHKNIYQPAKEAWVKAGSIEEEKEELPEPLPYIVVMIDELSDLMQAYPRELESAIVRLAQMSRAVGIHLILATQRPEVKVITGLIKANVPFRVALKVNSQIDSRTILDKVGAEKLVGKGDMLFQSSDNPDLVRVQSAYITEDETKNVVKYLKGQSEVHELESISFENDENDSSPDAFFGSVVDDEDEDDLYEDARQAVVDAGKASTSYLQRKLRVGYSRAARLMDILEERGVIGPQDGSKPREILLTGGESEAREESEPEDEHYA